MDETQNAEEYSCAEPVLINFSNTGVVCYDEILWLVCLLAELYVATLCHSAECCGAGTLVW